MIERVSKAMRTAWVRNKICEFIDYEFIQSFHI